MAETQKKRYEFIDLVKGVCIILVVIQHLVGQCVVNPPWLTTFRMPLYFMLSGIFFSTYGSFKVFLVKKANSLLVPFAAMWLLCVGYIYLHYDNPGKIDPLKFNVAIWFLAALFEVGVMFYFISLIRKEWIKFVLVLVISIGGYLLQEYKVDIPYYIDSAMTATIFYYFGPFVRKMGLLEERNRRMDWIYAWGSFAIFVGLAAFYPDKLLDLRLNRIYTPYPVFLASAVSGTATVFFFCKIIRRIPLISYWGHYSIITLCSHIFIYRLLQNWGVLKTLQGWLGVSNHYWYNEKAGAWVGVALVFFITIPLIWVLVRHVPFLCSQMPLIDPKTFRLYKSPRTMLRILIKGTRKGEK